MDQRPTAAQVRRLVAEITPIELQSDLRGTGYARFTYSAPGGNVEVAVSEWGGDTLVQVTPVSHVPPSPSMQLDLEQLTGIAGAGQPGQHGGGRRGSSRPKPASTRPRPASARPKPGSVRPKGPSVRPKPNGHEAAANAPSAARRRSASSRPALGLSTEPPIDRLFRRLVSEGASDLHLSSNEVPMIRKDGDMKRLDGEASLDAAQLLAMVEPIIPETNRTQFDQESDTDFAYAIEGLARFRANLFRDRHGIGAVFRTIPATIISAEKLGLSTAITDLCGLHKGLVLVTGPTGSGKSTTLCAMVDLINRTRAGHIITIEDPIEFVHQNKMCLINQREIGPHTRSFKRALRAALREDPDVVLVGEMRDLETIAIAIETAETGHLVFGTLHTTTAYSTIDRIIDQYPPDQQEQIRVMLSESLKGVVSQTLCKKIGGGRVAALEVLLVNPAVSNLIREGKTFQIPSIMQTSKNVGMRLLNEALTELVASKLVAAEEAIAKAVDKTGLVMALKSRGLA